jgi:uncharacterized membrane protein YgdD (TMEM256/DUF423 family)
MCYTPYMIRVAASFGFLAVALGAFGAHGLKDLLQTHDRVGTWETAVLYHLAHAVVLLIVALARPQAVWAFRCFAAGILVFSGTLYLLCLTQWNWLGAITPIGGLLLLAGWGGIFFNRR